MDKIFYCVLIFSVLSICSATICIEKTPCSCQLDKWSFINLSDLHPSQGSFFQDGMANKDKDITYFFAGCENRKFNPADYNYLNATLSPDSASLIRCSSAVTNQTTNGTTNGLVVNQTCSAIGLAENILFGLVSSDIENDNVKYQIIYQDTKSNKTAAVHLACGTYNRTDLKISNSNSDVLVLYSPLVCVQHISHHELSSGSIFCIIFFVAVFTYFIGGAVIMYFIRGARGVEVIPNFDFWVCLPGLMRDGLVYLLSGCRPFTVSSAETYDRI